MPTASNISMETMPSNWLSRITVVGQAQVALAAEARQARARAQSCWAWEMVTPVQS